MPIIEPRMLGLLPDDKTKSTFWVADDSNVERRVFDTDGNLFTPDGSTVDDRLNAVEAGIPPLDDARIVALEDAMLIAQGDITVIEGDIVTAEGDIDALEVTVGAEQLLLDQAQADIVTIQGDVVTLTADVVTANSNSTTAVNSVNAHIADVANPHVVTRAQIGAEAAGTAASAIVTHVALADPHAQYLKESASASEVEALPLNDANNYFTGTTIGDQMQEAGAHIADTSNPHQVVFADVVPNSTQVEALELIDAGGYYGITPTVGEALQQLGSDMFNVYEGNEGDVGQVLMSNGSGLASYENGDNIPINDAGAYFATDKVGAALQSVGASLAQKASLAELNEKTSYGVVSGLGVTQQAVPDMTVRVATGVVWTAAGTRFAPTANNALAVTAADATNPRIDIVYVNSSGVIAYLAGTAAASPAQPATPAGGQLLAIMLVTAGKTSILTADIFDRRKTISKESAIAPTLINSWVSNAFSPIQYYKDSFGLVHLNGRAGSGSSATIMFTLPIGYQPKIPIFAATSNSAYGHITIFVNTTGAVSVYGTIGTWVSIDIPAFEAA